ncbi:S53 family peptidase [Paracidobacterium acidisoli]|uniref:Peptidase S53 n=1 Tax=Paracidobacterium acidisoli TaxID=2303751 RepID=A0A372IPX4_9BACT|nr:S53 family peptidase [Paracidobacterium acidisoli]MBT9331100.1 S53 family peptidase [Paracidobacterium acidisoli]
MPGKSKGHVELKGSHRVPLTGARPVGKVDPADHGYVTVRLRQKESPKSFDKLVDGIMAQPLGERKYLTQEQLAELHGAPAASVAKIDAFAHEYNLTVIETSLAKRTVKLRGSLADLQKAFGVKLQKFRTGNITYRGRTGSVYIPRQLAGIVEGVFGLDDRPVAKPHIRIASSHNGHTAKNGHSNGRTASKSSAVPKAKSLSVLDVAALYNFPKKLDGEGQTIALIELNTAANPSQPKKLGSGYTLTDLNKFFKGLKLTTPQVTAVSVDGGANLPNLNPDADGEVELDIEVAGAIAPGASIAVYFAPNTDQGFIDALSSAVHDSVRRPSVISISWGGPEDFSTQQFLDGINAALKDAVALGITVLVAAGDSGSSDLPTQYARQPKYKGPHADFPASSPFALACGGTRLTGSKTTITSEVVWNEGRQGGAGGGGVSAEFAPPSWQAGLSMPSSSKPGRGLPDVAGNADPYTGYKIVLQGKTVPIGGTSAVAPLWAGLLTLINQHRASSGKPAVGFLNSTLYSLPATSDAFRDITAGNNDIDGNLKGQYTAGPGWDACTGLGSPNGTELLTALS